MSRKVDLYKLPRRARPAETRTFTDPEQPGVEISLTLREPNIPTAIYIEEWAGHHINEWVDSGKTYMVKDGSGEVVPIGRDLCTAVAALECLQEDGEDYLDFDNLIVLSLAMPSAWIQIMFWAQELAGKAEGLLKNAMGVPAARSSQP